MANSAPVGYDCAVPFSTSRAPHRTLATYARTCSLVAVPLVAAMLVVAGRLPAQAPPDSGARARPIIRAVEIHRAPIFDSLEARFWPYRAVNAVHADTRATVIRRELLFEAGQPFDTAKVNESARNLRALGLFQDVTIDSVATDSGLVVRVATTDGWTTGLSLDVKSSGSQSVFSAGITERNLLGRAAVATVEYVNDPDRSAILVGFDVPRVVANAIGIGASYLDRSDGRAGAANVRYPFYTLSSRRGASLSGQFVDARVLRFVGGRGFAIDSARHRLEILRGEAALALVAGPEGYTRLGISGQLRRQDFGLERPSPVVDRTVTAALGPFVSVRKPRFIQLRNFQSMGRIEDVDVGYQLRGSLLAAPRAWGYERDGVGGSLGASVGQRIPSGFVEVQGYASALRSSDQIDSATVDVSTTVVLQGGERHLAVGHASYGILKDPHPGAEFDLGLGYAVRAFPSHAFTGDRRFLLNAEYRLLVWPRLLGLVGVGAATFVDHAGAWYDGARRRTGTDAGVGLRLGSIREAGTVVGRLDLAYRFASDVEPAGWVVSIGRGFVFQRF